MMDIGLSGKFRFTKDMEMLRILIDTINKMTYGQKTEPIHAAKTLS